MGVQNCGIHANIWLGCLPMIDFVPAPATLPPGQRIYAIGDVHGCLDRLAAVHEQIAEDLATRPIDKSVLVHLGDYVDRGLDSAQVVDWLSGGAPVPVGRIVNLMGNHEDMMLQRAARHRQGGQQHVAGQWRRRFVAELGDLAQSPADRVGQPDPGRASDVPARSGHQLPSGWLHVRPCRHPARGAAGPAGEAGHAVDPGTFPVLEAFARR